MSAPILRRHLAVLTALAALAALPGVARADVADQGATSGHVGDPSGPPPPDDGADPASAATDPAPAPQSGVSPAQDSGTTVGITRATPGDTYDVVASAAPARASRRVFTIRIARGIHVATARVWVDGRPALVRYGRRTTARIDLRGTPKATVTVRIRIRTREGAVIEASRTYRTCEAKRAGGVPSV